MTGRTDPREETTTFSYNFAGRVDEVERPDETTEELIAWQIRGLANYPTEGTQNTPATGLVEVEADAHYTDPRGNLWQTRLDWAGFGRAIEMFDPLVNRSAAYRDADGLAWLDIDPLSRRTRREFDSSGNLTTLYLHPEDTDFTEIKQEFAYNSFSQMTESVDAIGHKTRYTYDTDGNLTELILPDDDDLGQSPNLNNNPKYVFTHDGDGNVLTETDPLGNLTSYEYDSRDRLIETTYDDDDTNSSNNPQVTLTYDTAGNLATRTDERGFVTTYDYDDVGRMVEMILPDDDMNSGNNPVYEYAYDASGNLTSITDPLLNVTSFTYDELDRRLTETNPLNDTTTYAYNAAGLLSSITNALSQATTFAYDAAGRQTGMTDPLSNDWTFAYDAAGQRTAEQNPLGHTTSYEFIGPGWMNKVIRPLNLTTIFFIDALGRVTYKLEPNENCCDWEFDAQGRVVQFNKHLFTSLGHATTVFTYNALNLVSRTDPDPDGQGSQESAETTFTYDARNRLKTETDPAGQVTEYAYDLAGNVASVTRSVTTDYTYDAQNRVLTATDPESGVIAYAYDLVGRLASITDPEDNETAYEYDDAGRLITRTDPLLNETTYGYDDAGRLTSMIDRNGREIEYVYDAAGRRTEENWLDGMGTPVHTFEYAYDDAGRLPSASDDDSAYAYTYDNADRLIEVDNLGTTGVPNIVLSSEYDTAGQRQRLADNLDGEILASYDNGNRLATIELIDENVSLLVEFEYDQAHRLTHVERSMWDEQAMGYTDPVVTDLAYDTPGRVTSITHSYDTTELSEFTYAYDTRSRLTDYTGPEGTFEYSYDDTDQLLGVSGDRTETYSYDSNGNRTMTGYTTGDNNQLTSDGTYNYAYDDEGNRTTRTHISTGEVTEYTWDYRNRLTKVVVKNSSGTVLEESRFTYDVNNNLILRWHDPDGAGSAAADQFFTAYDGIHPYADFEYNPTAEEFELTIRYLYGVGPVPGMSCGDPSDGSCSAPPWAIDQILARVNVNGDADFYVTDHLGSVRQIVGTDGTILNEINYDSFLNVVSETNPSAGDRFKGAGREWEAAADLYFNRARWYDPSIGRFIGEDPLEFKAGDSNLYRYVANNSTNRTDPLGLWAEHITDGNWDARHFFVVHLGGTLEEWETFKKGCVGLCMVRLGELEKFPEDAPGVRCFTTLAAAQAHYATLIKAGKEPLLFAVQTKKPLLPLPAGRQPPADPNEVYPDQIDNSGPYNYASQLECFGKLYWEWMDHGLLTHKKATVTHSPNLPKGYTNTYCVSPSRNEDL
jgi:RHS repeat-associated protein